MSKPTTGSTVPWTGTNRSVRVGIYTVIGLGGTLFMLLPLQTEVRSRPRCLSF
ncbi:MAG TPA: hypothetical protein VEZ50_09310 [Nodosilinea sp.]|nr:hypothetical protein [Nodosilinea sp.]